MKLKDVIKELRDLQKRYGGDIECKILSYDPENRREAWREIEEIGYQKEIEKVLIE